jgi:hypothetical protein
MTLCLSIIAIHGLNGHRERTFTADNNVNWLSSLLPQQFPKVRVMTYGYDAKTHSSGTLTQEFLHGHAEQFVQDVTERRQDTEVCQISSPAIRESDANRHVRYRLRAVQ